MNNLSTSNNRLFTIIIGILSVAIPLVVAFLLFVPQSGSLGDLDVSFLPHLNACLNTATSIALVFGFVFVKSKRVDLHRVAMFVAVALSTLFLVSYVIYHFQGIQTKHPGHGLELGIYYFILFTHILLAVVVVPLVLFAVYYAISNQIDKHKKIVKYTFPVWLYVSVTGVIVYLLISPYYK